MADDNPLYAGIPNPSSVRREILLGTKDVLSILKSFEELQSLREHKQAVLSDLKRTTDAIVALNRKLKQAIPKAPIKSIPKVERRDDDIVHDKKTFVAPRPKVAPVSKEQSKIDLLEQELAKIEAELQGLE